ncbi:MAG: polymer-forming cytoskeletal protein [Thermoanaerobaculia bacterium]|nr:polymer-forming cytoskeletal protein [Thermoanaerobaculia bacterium]
MWKRENETSPMPTPAAPPSPTVAPRRDPEPAAAPPPRAAEASTGRAIVGAATVVRGELAGEEDLMVEGRVEGKILLPQNAVTVGAKGRVAAEVHARVILIDGEVEGNLVAEEQIVIRRSGRVRGDLVSPRVSIEDGARFKGSIDMEPKRAAAPVATPSPRPANIAKSDPLSASLAAAVGGNS